MTPGAFELTTRSGKPSRVKLQYGQVVRHLDELVLVPHLLRLANLDLQGGREEGLTPVAAWARVEQLWP